MSARPARWRPPADVTATDIEYFQQNPGARHRFRPNGKVHRGWPVIVIATVERDDAGRPIATSINQLYRYDGGHA
jgi:hypothetical protein